MPPSGEEGTDSMLLVRINVHACAPAAVSIDTMAKGSCFCPREHINSRESCGAIAVGSGVEYRVENTVRTSTADSDEAAPLFRHETQWFVAG